MEDIEIDILIRAAKNPGLSQTELYQPFTALGFGKTRLFECLRRLISGKYLQPKPDTDDKRKVKIYATTKGKRAIGKETQT